MFFIGNPSKVLCRDFLWQNTINGDLAQSGSSAPNWENGVPGLWFMKIVLALLLVPTSFNKSKSACKTLFSLPLWWLCPRVRDRDSFWQQKWLLRSAAWKDESSEVLQLRYDHQCSLLLTDARECWSLLYNCILGWADTSSGSRRNIQEREGSSAISGQRIVIFQVDWT